MRSTTFHFPSLLVLLWEVCAEALPERRNNCYPVAGCIGLDLAQTNLRCLELLQQAVLSPREGHLTGPTARCHMPVWQAPRQFKHDR